jgi:hypothetical protein
MRTSAKLGLTALAATLLLSTAISTASARNLSVSNANWRAIWSRFEIQTSVGTVRCRVTLEGFFHSRTIAKTAGLLIGAVTRAEAHRDSCTGGRIAFETAPSHLTYEGYTGTLPNITSIRLLLARINIAIAVSAFGIPTTCHYGNEVDNITLSAALDASREITELTQVAGRNTATLTEGGFGCSGSGTLVSWAGDGLVRLLGSTTRIRVTLI